MNRTDFLNMIENTSSINRQMTGEVYELIDIFPYFQSAHLLLLKGLQNIADVKFENQLRNSAIHLADREVLYNLLKTITSPEAEKADSQKETVSEVEPDDRRYDIDSGSDKQQTVIESAKNSQYLINEIEQNSVDAVSNEGPDGKLHSHSHPILVSSESENEDSAGVMLVMDEESSQYEDHVFFMDPGFSLPEQGDLLELDLDDNKNVGFEEGVADSQPHDQQDQISSRKLQSDLIDKFIITNPRIEPNRDKTPLLLEDISKPSVEEQGGFVTETLARIFINQGYYSRAIDIYEKLSLKFPEKSSYFASQIEKVKEYLKK